MAQAERGLALVDAGPEQFEFESGPQLAHGRRREPSHAQPALAYAGERVAVLAELPSNEGSLLTRIVSVQFGSMVFRLMPMSSMAKP